MTPTGLPRWNVITSIGAVSEAVARGGGGAHGSVAPPPWSPGPRDGLAGTVPAVVGGTACAPESPRQPRAHSAERPILAAGTPSPLRSRATAAQPPPGAPTRIQWASDGRRSSPDVRVPRGHRHFSG